MHATDFSSKSKEVTVAPNRRAARLNKPLPEPMSRNDRPLRSRTNRAFLSDSSAARIRSSFRLVRKRAQFSPNLKRLLSFVRAIGENFAAYCSRDEILLSNTETISTSPGVGDNFSDAGDYRVLLLIVLFVERHDDLPSSTELEV